MRGDGNIVITTLQGDCRAVLPTLPEKSVQMVCTSPPFYGLRAYLPAGHPDKAREIGQEPIPDCLAWARRRIIGVAPAIDEDGETYYIPTYGKPEPPCGGCYVCALRAVFAGVWRVLRDDGTLWLNLGDSYAGSWGNYAPGGIKNQQRQQNDGSERWERGAYADTSIRPPTSSCGIPEKNLLGIPWRVALALQADGWVLRNDNIWAKANPMPESVQDRCTRAHEYVFMLAKGPRYYYDQDAIREPHKEASLKRYEYGLHVTPDPNAIKGSLHDRITAGVGNSDRMGDFINPDGRNKRTVWNINCRPYADAHYAVFPEALVEIPIRAGSSAQACEYCGAAWRRVVEREEISPEKRVSNPKQAHLGHGTSARINTPEYGHAYVSTRRGTTDFFPGCTCENNTGSAASVVLDCFAGSGTTLRVAERLGRNAIGIELSADYIEDHIEKRTNGVQREMFV